MKKKLSFTKGLMASASVFFALAFFVAPYARAQESITVEEAGFVFEGVSIACYRDGSCNLCDIMVVLVNVADLLLKGLGIVAVIFLVYGAGWMMLSFGNQERVTKGKG